MENKSDPFPPSTPSVIPASHSPPSVSVASPPSNSSSSSSTSKKKFESLSSHVSFSGFDSNGNDSAPPPIPAPYSSSSSSSINPPPAPTFRIPRPDDCLVIVRDQFEAALSISQGRSRAYDPLREAAANLAISTTSNDPTSEGYELLFRISGYFFRGHLIPSYCALCWKTSVPARSGDLMPVPIIESHTERDCLLKHVGDGQFIKQGVTVSASKVKDYLCCQNDDKAVPWLASCEGITGECEGKLEALVIEQKNKPDGELDFSYGRWLWIAVSAICWRRMVHRNDKPWSGTQPGSPVAKLVTSAYIRLENVLRIFLLSVIKSKQYEKKKEYKVPGFANDDPVPVAAPTFFMYATAAPPVQAELDRMFAFVCNNNVESFTLCTPSNPPSFIVVLSIFNIHFVIADEQSSQFLNQHAGDCTWIPIEWMNAESECKFQIPKPTTRKLHPFLSLVLSAQAQALVNHIQSIPITKNSTVASAEASEAKQVEPPAGSALYSLPPFIMYQPSLPVSVFGEFKYADKYQKKLLFQRVSAVAKIEICRLIAPDPRVPSYWLLCTAQIVNDHGTVLASAWTFDVEVDNQLKSGSIKPAADTLLIRDHPELRELHMSVLEAIWPEVRTKIEAD